MSVNNYKEIVKRVLEVKSDSFKEDYIKILKEQRKKNIDKRERIKDEDYFECSTCGANNFNYMNCWFCGLQISKNNYSNFSIFFKYGKKVVGERSNTKAKDYAIKNAADLLQPTYYDKGEKKVKLNKDFIEVYGDPFKQRATVGSAVEKAVDSGTIKLNVNE